MAEVMTTEEIISPTNLVNETDADAFMTVDETPQDGGDKKGAVSERAKNIYKSLNELRPSWEDLSNLNDYINNIKTIKLTVNNQLISLPIECSVKRPNEYSNHMNGLYIRIGNNPFEEKAGLESSLLSMDCLYNSNNNPMGREGIDKINVIYRESTNKATGGKYNINDGIIEDGDDTIVSFFESSMEALHDILVDYLKKQ